MKSEIVSVNEDEIHVELKDENHISIERYNAELDEAEAGVDRGEFFTHEEVEKMLADQDNL